MAIGSVVWFNRFKGYGFIRPDGGGKDVFVHMSAVEQAGLQTLVEGQRVRYELVTASGKMTAGHLRISTTDPSKG
ncbi:cold-shock protein [Bradyrhizobium sp. CCBAU 45389]|uniref:cold-shock protein n=1 Tax=Bradyrhizobium sp. CCBAU 45389 TaxID=858429 RepID=UPI002304F01A|nr:cold-shock protein [Bradyrhizobium sp. CCBAU 45389]